jgi:ribosomal protein S17E
MGRTKTLYVKRKTQELMELHGHLLTEDFEKNKGILASLVDAPSVKMRNVIIGYATRLKKRERMEARARRAVAAASSRWEPREQRFSQRRRRTRESLGFEYPPELQAF